MLTKIAAVTGVLVALLQGAVLFGAPISQDQQSWLAGFIVLVGGAVHSWWNPDIPVGK